MLSEPSGHVQLYPPYRGIMLSEPSGHVQLYPTVSTIGVSCSVSLVGVFNCIHHRGIMLSEPSGYVQLYPP